MPADIDAAAIMAEHQEHSALCTSDRYRGRGAQRCLPYLLAAAVATLRAQVEAVRALCGGPYSDGYRPYAVEIDDDVILTIGLDKVRAAIALGGLDG